MAGKLKERFDVYQVVTDRIIAQLEKGCVPWVKPWETMTKAGGTALTSAFFPVNGKTGRAYTGVMNTLLLWMTADEKGYRSNKWYTFNQVKELGYSVKGGEKSTMIFFFEPKKKTVINNNGEEEDKIFPFVKWFFMFNAEQTTIPEEHVAAPEKPVVPENELNPTIETWLDATGIVRRHGGDRAYYSTKLDRVQLPFLKQFTAKSGAENGLKHYYSTAFHEYIHATGHKSRLNRIFGKRFGDQAYSAEELVAELGASYLCAQHGVVGELRHAGYIAHWLENMKKDSHFIVTVAGMATKACKYLNSFSETEEQEEPELLAA